MSRIVFICGRNLPDGYSFILACYYLFLIEQTWEKDFFIARPLTQLKVLRKLRDLGE